MFVLMEMIHGRFLNFYKLGQIKKIICAPLSAHLINKFIMAFLKQFTIYKAHNSIRKSER